ncbi:MAG: hypothetical protein JSW25_08370 [Thermoplasmata archaeon]|nr:MAG: hypothetical protein JSW25_08370 [Thermoplasmata archaeon]
MGVSSTCRVRWVLLGVLAVLVLVSSVALAGSEEDAVVLAEGEVHVVTIDNGPGEGLWIEYEVEVLWGPPLNVFFTDAQGYTEFFDDDSPSFTYYAGFSHEETHYAEESFYFDDEGLFYLIIDNDHNQAEGQNVTVQYSVSWEASEFEGMLVVGILIMIIVIIVVIVMLIALVTVKRTQALAAEAKDSIEDEEVHTVTPPDAGNGRPQPPEPYPEWVVRESMGAPMDDDDATGWDPGRDEPED